MERPASKQRHSSKLIGLSEAALYLGVTPKTIARLLRKGRLHAIRIPGLRRTLVDRDDLNSLIEEAR